MGKKGNKVIWSCRVLALLVCIGLIFAPKLKCEAATSASKEAFKTELRQMIFQVDTATHDVSKYDLTIDEMKEIYSGLKREHDTRWMVAAYYSNFDVAYTFLGNKVKKVYLKNVDDEVMKRYPVLLDNVNKILSGIEPTMTDLDKIIYLHDCLTEIADYKYLGYQSYGAGGILGEGYGVCAGYTKTMCLLLEELGFKSRYISSSVMNHGWNGVVLNGNWYHMDVTWDDPTGAKPGETKHTYLLMSDKAISSGKNPHSGWEFSIVDPNEKYTSEKYDNWYVHDIIGKMCFENGKWYYVDVQTNCIMENTAEGGKARVVLNAKGQTKLEMVDATSSGITYKQSGVVKKVGYNGSNTGSADVPSNVSVAEFYLMPKGSDSYVMVGTGYIENAKKSSDVEYIKKSLVTIPDVSDYLGTDQAVEWNKITVSGSGKYFVKGYVHDVEPEMSSGIEDEGTEAAFYLMLAGSESYTSVGTGVIREAKKSSDVNFVQNNVISAPDISKYLKAGQEVEWNKITMSGSGKFFVKGIVKTTEPQTPAASNTPTEPVGTKATFYLSKAGYSGLINLGSGHILGEGSSSKDAVISSRIEDMPNVTEYVGSDEYIVWVKLTFNTDKASTVRGEVRKK